MHQDPWEVHVAHADRTPACPWYSTWVNKTPFYSLSTCWFQHWLRQRFQQQKNRRQDLAATDWPKQSLRHGQPREVGHRGQADKSPWPRLHQEKGSKAKLIK